MGFRDTHKIYELIVKHNCDIANILEELVQWKTTFIFFNSLSKFNSQMIWGFGVKIENHQSRFSLIVSHQFLYQTYFLDK
jgi:hypothetical protein